MGSTCSMKRWENIKVNSPLKPGFLRKERITRRTTKFLHKQQGFNKYGQANLLTTPAKINFRLLRTQCLEALADGKDCTSRSLPSFIPRGRRIKCQTMKTFIVKRSNKNCKRKCSVHAKAQLHTRKRKRRQNYRKFSTNQAIANFSSTQVSRITDTGQPSIRLRVGSHPSFRRWTSP